MSTDVGEQCYLLPSNKLTGLLLIRLSIRELLAKLANVQPHFGLDYVEAEAGLVEERISRSVHSQQWYQQGSEWFHQLKEQLDASIQSSSRSPVLTSLQSILNAADPRQWSQKQDLERMLSSISGSAGERCPRNCL